VPSRLHALPRRRLLSAAIALAAGTSLLSPGAQATTAPTASTMAARPASTCPLGAFTCPRRPVSYALCRPNALLAFYVPGLPEDTVGRATAATDMDADRAASPERGRYRLDGHVHLQRYDQLLRAEHLDYDASTTAYHARGDVRYQDSGMLLSATHMDGTTTPERGAAANVHYQLLKSHGNGTAKQARLLDAQRSAMQQATYSTCDPQDRTWEFRADSIHIDRSTGVGVARDATMRLKGVPFMYLPYLSFPVDNRRRSGFLYPMFGGSSNAGYMFSIPYYLNLAPNYDATLTPRIYSDRGLMLQGQFRYLTAGSRGLLEAQYLPNDTHAHTDSGGRERADLADGANRYYVRFKDSTKLASQWSFHTDIRHVSDRYFFRDFSSDLMSSVASVLASNAYVSGRGNWWSAAVGVDRYESIDPRLTTAGLQYRRWPRAVFNADLPVAGNLEFNLASSAVAFRKDNAVQGNRIDLYPSLTLPMAGAAWFVRPTLAYRFTGYRLQADHQHYGYADGSPSTALPIASVDSGLIFERDAHLFGNHYTQTLEPRLYYLYVPYRNQNDQPIFDTRLMTFDYWQLFSPNRFSGADRQMNANNLTAAVTSRLLDDGGVERASVSVGQIRYFTPQRVQLYPNLPTTDYAGSDYVAEASLSLSDNWRVQTAYQWDPNQRRTAVGTLGLQRRLGVDGVLNFSYRYRDRFLEQFDVSAVYPVSPRWRLLGRWNVSLRDSAYWHRGRPKTLDAIAGVEYDSCCVKVRLVGHHYVRNVQGDTNNAIMLEIEFKGLGSVAPQTESMLRRAILGYQ
jgi:LPS-assembly protein